MLINQICESIMIRRSSNQGRPFFTGKYTYRVRVCAINAIFYSTISFSFFFFREIKNECPSQKNWKTGVIGVICNMTDQQIFFRIGAKVGGIATAPFFGLTWLLLDFDHFLDILVVSTLLGHPTGRGDPSRRCQFPLKLYHFFAFLHGRRVMLKWC